MKTVKTFLIVTFLLVSYFSYSQTVVINEVQTDNVNTIRDEDGDYSSWIEIFNPTDASLNLEDYGLSNDPANPFLWTFPQLVIEPDQYIVVFASGKDRKQYEDYHWETLINQGDSWKFKIGDASIRSNWKYSSYNDASWQEGPSGFGYGDSDDATILGSSSNPIPSVFIRKKFTIEDIDNITELVLDIDYDDGFVAYMNGSEVKRMNMGSVGSTVNYNTYADNNHEADLYGGDPPSRFVIDKKHLVSGENVIAIQGHNVSRSSSDFSLIPFLTVLMREAPLKARGTPSEILFESRGAAIHTNFTLDTEKCTLFLTSPNRLDGDTITANYVSTNDSKGLDQNGNVVMFAVPSPGKENYYTSLAFGQLDEVQFSVKSGFYSDAITLELSSDYKDGIIRYTTNGSVPGRGSKIYNQAIRISKTSVVKAYVFGGRYTPSDISTKSYFINDESTLPVVSISFKPDDFFGGKDGIYVPGPNVSTSWPYSNANYWGNTERRVSIEYFNEAGNKQFEVEADASISGDESRTYPQKSLHLELEKTNSDYHLFPGCELSTLNSFTLSNGNEDWAHTLLNESFMQSIVKDLDLDLRHRHPCIVYLNGVYWGIHEVKEDLDVNYIQRRSELDEDRASLLCYDLKLSPTIAFGQKKDYELLWYKTNSNVIFSDTRVDDLRDDIDIENLVNYFIFQIYIANTQWPGKNQCFWHNGLSSGKWRWIPTDFDRGFGLSVHGDYHYGHYNPNAYQHPTLNKVLVPSNSQGINPYYSTLILRRLLSNKKFKQYFINRFADLLNTNFLPEKVHGQCNSRSEELSNEINRHFEKWKSNLILNSPLEWKTSLEWDLRIESLKDFSTKRHTEMYKQLSEEFQLSGSKDVVRLTVNDPSMGYINLNSLELTLFPWEGKYFSDVPVKITAVPHKGYRFVAWEGLKESSAHIEVLPEVARNLKAIFEKDDTVHAFSVAINEINYVSNNHNSAGEWIELYNSGNEDADLGGWILNSNSGAFPYEFPEDFILEQGKYIVISNSINQFITRHPNIYNIIGESDFDLDDTEGTITLHSGTGDLVDSVFYSSDMPWPDHSDEDSKTLALLSPFSNNLNLVNWKVADGYGTPGEDNYDFYTTLHSTNTEPEPGLFPNPFSDVVNISLKVNKPENFSVVIFDQMGRQITVLSKHSSAGSTCIYQWDGCNSKGRKQVPGIYYCKIQGSQYSETFKLLLIQ